MSVSLIGWPYDLGLEGVGVGLGADALLGDSEVAASLATHVEDVEVVRVDGVDERRPEMARIFELERSLATRVATARREGRFPLVAAGNCISCLGTVCRRAGRRPAGCGLAGRSRRL